MDPPTSYLIPILQLQSQTPDLLYSSLHYLRKIYSPPVRGSRKFKPRAPPNLASTSSSTGARGYSSARVCEAETASSVASALETLRSDAFERSYAIRWLTALVSKGLGLGLEENLVAEAASLLAACAGTASAGIIERVFEFPLGGAQPGFSHHEQEPSIIRIKVRDTPLENHDYTSVGKQTWGGACILSEMIAEQPERFFDIAPTLTFNHEPRSAYRVLELGAGTGLVGLTAFQVLRAFFPTAAPKRLEGVQLIATDFHGAVLDNLEHNIQHNLGHQDTPHPMPSTSSSGFSDPPRSMQFSMKACKLDWSDFANLPYASPPLDEQFDIALGADIIYEVEHATWIKECLLKLLRRPQTSELPEQRPVFHLVIPLRHTHLTECRTVEDVFPLCTEIEFSHPAQLVTLYKETVTCSGEEGKEGDEVEYVYYRIGWRE